MRKDCLLERPFRTVARNWLPAQKTLFLFLFTGFALLSFGQKQGKLEIVQGEMVKSLPSLRNFRPDPNHKLIVTRDLDGLIFKKTAKIETPDYGSRTPNDPVVQQAASPAPVVGNAIGQNYDGMGFTNVAPADPTMATGGNYVLQMINGPSGSYLKIWDKTGAVVVNQVYMDLLFTVPGYDGAGDPVVLYDQFADRYFITEFGRTGGTSFINTLIVAVSQTNNPAGGWNLYKYVDNTFFVDYPHWGVWPNALYATSNDFNTAGTAYLGSSVYAFDKAAMIAGQPTALSMRQRFSNPSNSYLSMAPVSISGNTPPPAGSPGLFAYFSDDSRTADPADVDFLQLMTFQPDFANPANSVIANGATINTAPFQSRWCPTRNCIPSAGGGYDAIADRIMNRIYYRNFGTHEAMVMTHTVNANAGTPAPGKAGLRWYELRRTGSNWGMYQQSTYAPDGDSRWMGTIGINAAGQIALGYNHSGAGKFASVYFVGRNAGDPLNAMTTAETLVFEGTGYGTFSNRWGDYNDIATDANDATFWMTAMYGIAGQWRTRIASFTLGDACPTISVSPATLPNYNYNRPYSATLSATGGAAPYSFTITSGALPTGLTLNPSTGVISGTPTATTNSSSVVVSARDANGCSGTKAYTLSTNNPFDNTNVTTFCNSNPITIPSSGMGVPYPSNVIVSGVPGAVGKVTVTLKKLNHTWSEDVDIMLVSPSGQRSIILSDVGGSGDFVNTILTLDDEATQSLPETATNIGSGTYKPTNNGASDPFPAPAPGTTANSTLGVFNGINPNGTWSLYVLDDEQGDLGNIAEGWCLTFTTTTAPTITCPSNVTTNTEPGVCTASVTLPAATTTGNPSATVSYSVGGSPITSPYNFPKGTTTVTATASNGVAPDATCTFDVTVNDAEPPTVTTCPPAQTFAFSNTGNYTIPQLVAADNCPGVSVSYSITGATNRSGNGADASGAFNVGISTIAWTVTDASNNTTTTCATTVTVNPPCTLSATIPDVSVLPSGVSPNTVYRGYAPAVSITLTAQPSGGAAPYGYLWSNGATTQSITVSPTMATTYMVTVTSAGCDPATASKLVNVVDVHCGKKLDKVTICHIPSGNIVLANTNCIDASDVANHLAHGDYLGACGVASVASARINGNVIPGLKATAFSAQALPNPSQKDFTLVLSSAKAEPVQVSVLNAVGKLVERRNGVAANGSFTLGNNYRPGVYYAVIVQGDQRITIKLVKGSN